ncbi:FGGY family carbohydrate kinase, partial [Pseudorhodoplanes sp.]|uniref:FGGY family carbohydrate kinase n=1 Tax=Pseudorhodoplanes sp. TaxID=1934341 RepID=UPI003D0DE26E
MRTIIGIDIGTSATRATLIGIDGTQLCVASRPHRVSEPKPGHVEHDAERMWWDEVCETLREIAEKRPQQVSKAEAIGISAIGASIVPVDAEGKALRPAILYGVDRRALSQIASLENRLGADEICRKTGRQLSSQSVGPKILWIKENEPEIYSLAQAFLPPTAFVSKRLCGVSAIDLHTALTLDPLFLPREKKWNPDFLPLICRTDQLPQVHKAGTPIGKLSAEVAT